MAMGSMMNDGDVNMENVDRVFKGKDKGKHKKGDGKSKGKKSDGKGKRKNFSKGNDNKGKGYSQNFVQHKGKGYGQNYTQNDGKGKHQDKGKGKWKNTAGDGGKTCFKCGKNGHVAKECWSNVRQVQGQGDGDGASSVQVGAMSEASSAQQTTVAPSRSASNRVRRVEQQHTNTVLVDLQCNDDCDDEIEIEYVRMVSTKHEEFFIGDDTDGQFSTCDHVPEYSLLEDNLFVDFVRPFKEYEIVESYDYCLRRFDDSTCWTL